jgi:hypothetical protein
MVVCDNYRGHCLPYDLSLLLIMKRMLKVALFSIFILILVWNPFSAFSQCAMCKAVVTNNAADGADRLSESINSGILYLMTVPYLILGSIFFFAFKKQIMAKWRSLKG